MSLKMSTAKANPGFRMPQVKGTKPSIQNAQLLISTGIPSLDYVFGGGLAIGTIMLIEEDTYGHYAESMLKYFMAEGVASSQAILVASQDENPTELLSKIPAVSTDTEKKLQLPVDSQMEIAWRYQNMKIVDTSPTGPNDYGHYFDLTKQMGPAELEQTEKSYWDGKQIKWHAEAFKNSAYADLLKTVKETIKNGNFSLNNKQKPKTVLRIAMHSIGSRLWFSDDDKDSHSDLCKFFYFLRAILKNSFAVAVVTFPAHYYDQTPCLVERLEHSVDYAIRLESFAGSSKATNPIFKDYHGLLHVKKIATINTLKPHKPHSSDLAFKMRRKKFIVEVLHLPPELGDSSQREQDDLANASTGCCSTSSNKNPVDF